MRDWLILARSKAGLTQQETAKRLNISRQYYTMIEKGERQKSIDIQLAVKIGKIFNIPLEQIAEYDNVRA